jgi:histidinol-phosphate phosphatase family protein
MRAVVLCGGRGTRLAGVAGPVPKPLVPVAGRPVLDRILESLAEHGFHDVVLTVGHLADAVRRHVGDGSRHGVRVEYAQETEPLGTAGALVGLRDRLGGDFLVVYGDLVLDLDLRRVAEAHRASGGACTLTVHPNDHPYDSDVVDTLPDGRVRAILPKNTERTGWYANQVNAGVLVLNTELLAPLEPGRAYEIERDLVLLAVARGEAYAYRTSEYVRDMGTPERLARAERDLLSGLVASRRRAEPRKAVFLDRDGTLNRLVGLVTEPGQLEIPETTYQALAAINASEYLAVVVTNQSVLARGLCTVEELDEIHRSLETRLGERGVYIDALYYCPHHPDGGYPEEVPELKTVCACRKPATGLLDQAAADLNLDLGACFLVGDSAGDMEAARRAGMPGVLADPDVLVAVSSILDLERTSR